MNLKLFILFLIASTSLSIAQTPSWDYILENDFEKAKEGFSKELEQDSTNIQSLLGAIFIADIYQDRSRFHKLSNLLFKHSNDPMVWNAFLSSSTPLVEKKKLISHPYLDTPEGKIAGMVALYFKDPYDKHISYEETKSKFDPIYQNDGWAFIGPFKNINGYSHLEVYPPELSRSPDWNASYDNEVGLKLKWIRPKYHAPSGQINIKDFLSTKTNTNLFYAHKSVFLPEEKKLQLRIKRELPMKLWVDGKLVFDNPNPIGSVLSGEILELDLTKGRHDILVKLSKFDGWQSYSGKFPFTSIYSYGRGNNYNFNVRFTDLNGTPLALPKGTQKQAEGQLLTYKQLDTDIIKAMINKLTASSEESRTNLSSYYVLARYAVKAKKTREVEKFFVELEKKMPNSTYIDLLLATIYERNGNRALSFRTVSKIDLEKTPHYATLNKKLNELDQKVDKDLYEEKLEFLRAIAPSNENMLRKYLRYYTGENDTARLLKLKEETLKEYPHFDKIFEKNKITASKDKKEDKKKKKNNFKGPQPFKKRLNNINSEIERYPYVLNYYQRKIDMLREEEMWDEALQTANEALQLTPYAPKVYAAKGRIYKEKNMKDSALKYLNLSLDLKNYGRRSYSYYGGQSISAMIAQLEDKEENLWESFETPSLEDIMAKKEEWMATYGKEDALVLMHTSLNWLKPEGDSETKEKFALIILNENGISEWTQQSFSFLGSRTTVEIIKPDGSRVQPEKSGSYAVFKNLEVGDIIWGEGSSSFRNYKRNGLTYGFKDYGAFKGGKNFKSPVFYQKFEVASSSEEKLRYQSINVPAEVNISERDGYIFHNWEWYHTPKRIREDAAYNYYAGSPEIFLNTELEWQAFSDWYRKLNYRKLEPNYYLQDLYKEIVNEEMSDKEKVVAIYNYITKEVSYSSASFLQSNFEPQEPQLTSSSGIGDCKDVATLMLTFLKMADIESYFVLVRAGQYLPYKPLTANVFNHAIVAYVLDGETNYLDLTTDKYPHYVLAEHDHEGWALLIKDGKQDLFRLPNDKINPEKNTVKYDLLAKLDEKGGLNLTVEGDYKGIEGGRFREFLGTASGAKLDAFIQKELNLSFIAGNVVERKEFHNMDSIDIPLKMEMEIRAENFAEKLYGLYIFPLPLLERIEMHEEFLPTKRQSVMDLNKVLNLSPKDETVVVEIPDGYELFAEPEDVSIKSEFGTYDLKFETSGNKLIIKKKHTFMKSKIFIDEYGAFREWYFKVSRLDAGKVVLTQQGFKYPNR